MRELGHVGVEVNERDLFDRGVFENLAQRESVAAAEHEHAAHGATAVARQSNRRVNERLVVSVLVGGAELQVAVQEKLEARAVARDDDALVGGSARVYDVVCEHAVFGERGQAVGLYEADGQERHKDARLRAQA